MCAITLEEFIRAADEFFKISQKINDGWLLCKTGDTNKLYLKKETFMENISDDGTKLLKTEYIICYNPSYGVPSFSFNIWDSSGVLVTLEKIRRMSFINISEKDFYSVITQQEHPIFFRPYFVMHPCHTAELLDSFKGQSKNIIVTFLGLITPLINMNMSLEYGL